MSTVHVKTTKGFALTKTAFTRPPPPPPLFFFFFFTFSFSGRENVRHAQLLCSLPMPMLACSLPILMFASLSFFFFRFSYASWVHAMRKFALTSVPVVHCTIWPCLAPVSRHGDGSTSPLTSVVYPDYRPALWSHKHTASTTDSLTCRCLISLFFTAP